MIYLDIFPGVAFVVLIILGVIVVILKKGPQLCKLRHHALPDSNEWREGQAYEQGISYA